MWRTAPTGLSVLLLLLLLPPPSSVFVVDFIVLQTAAAASGPDGEAPPTVRRHAAGAAAGAAGAAAVAASTFCAANGIYFRQLLAGVDFAAAPRNEFERQTFRFAKQMQNYVYLVGDRQTGEAVVVDGAWDPRGIKAIAKADGMRVKAFVATHYHYDHTGGFLDHEPFKSMGVQLPGLREFVLGASAKSRARRKGRPIARAYISRTELADAARRTGVGQSALTPLDDGSVLEVGRRLSLRFRHTPGHSPGSMVVLVEDRGGKGAITEKKKKKEEEEEQEAVAAVAEVEELLVAPPGGRLVSPRTGGGGGAAAASGDDDDSLARMPDPLFMISGDTLFPGSCGRVDLPESDPRVMWDSLQTVASYDDQLVVFPGHAYSGPNTTIGREKRHGLLGISRDQWMQGR